MSKLLICLVLATALNFIPTAASAQNYSWQSLSPDDAIQVVRAFEGDPNLAVTVDPPLDISSAVVDTDPTDFDESGYRLTSARYDYTVSKFTPNRFIRIDRLFKDNKAQFYGQPYDPNVLASQNISREAAAAVAQQFMQAHYPHPEVLVQGKITAHHDYDPHGTGELPFIDYYIIGFYQQYTADVDGPAYCVIQVDAVRGQVIWYQQLYYPVLISPTPQLTPDQMMASAVNTILTATGVPSTVSVIPGRVGGLYVTKPDAMGVESLARGLRFDVSDNDNSMATTVVATVDANNGNVLDWTTLQSLKPPIKKQPSAAFQALRLQMAQRNALAHKSLMFSWAGRANKLVYPLILVETVPYLCAAYLCYGASGAKMASTGKQVRVTGGGRDVSLSLNARTYQVNGQTHTASAKPVLVNGRCYVPLDVVQAVLPGTFRYEPKTRTVRFDPPAPKQARK